MPLINSKDTKKIISKKNNYLDVIKAYKEAKVAEIFECWKKHYNPLYKTSVIKRLVCKEMEIASTSFYEAIRANAQEADAFEKKQIFDNIIADIQLVAIGLKRF